MKESNFLVGNATIKQHQKEILLNTKGQYMKESNILVGNATIKQNQKEILLNTKGQYMKELDSFAGFVISNILQGKILKTSKTSTFAVVQLDKKFVNTMNTNTRSNFKCYKDKDSLSTYITSFLLPVQKK